MQDEKPPMKKLPTSMLPEETAPRPEFPEQEQTLPGLDAEMEPSPDHGETSYTGTGRLAGKKALITGGDSGIGRAVAIAFAREGADVAISYLPEEQEDADEVIALIVPKVARQWPCRGTFAPSPSVSRWWPTRWNNWEA